MNDIVFGHAKGPKGILEYLACWLVGAGLLCGDDTIDVAAELGDIARDDVVIGIGDDAELEALPLERAERCDDL